MPVHPAASAPDPCGAAHAAAAAHAVLAALASRSRSCARHSNTPAKGTLSWVRRRLSSAMERPSSSGSDRDGEDEVEVVVEEELEPEDVEAKAVDDEAEERPAEEEATAEPPEAEEEATAEPPEAAASRSAWMRCCCWSRRPCRKTANEVGRWVPSDSICVRQTGHVLCERIPAETEPAVVAWHAAASPVGELAEADRAGCASLALKRAQRLDRLFSRRRRAHVARPQRAVDEVREMEPASSG